MTLNSEATLGEDIAFQALILNGERSAWVGCGNDLNCQAVVRTDFGADDR